MHAGFATYHMVIRMRPGTISRRTPTATPTPTQMASPISGSQRPSAARIDSARLMRRPLMSWNAVCSMIAWLSGPKATMRMKPRSDRTPRAPSSSDSLLPMNRPGTAATAATAK